MRHRCQPTSVLWAALGLFLLASGSARANMPPVPGFDGPPSRHATGARALPFTPVASATAMARTSSQTLWRVPVVLVSYSDSALRYTAATFNQTLFDTTGASPIGSVNDYYDWVSGSRLRVVPTIVATVTVPNPRSYYGQGFWGENPIGTQNSYGLTVQALQLCPSSIDWSQFDQNRDGLVDMLWVVHAGIGGEGSHSTDDLWSSTWRMTSHWNSGQKWETPTLMPGSTTQHIFVDRFSILPELSIFQPLAISEIGVYCHEFGHALGLPDLYDTQTNGYPNCGPGVWSLMSTGVYGGTGYNPEQPSRPGAWCEQFLGWLQAVKPTQDTTLTLAPLARGGTVLDLWFQGEATTEHFLIENRRPGRYDQLMPASGLVIYHVDEAAVAQRLPANLVNAGPNPALVVVEADGRGDLLDGYDKGDSTDVFPGPLHRSFLYDAGPPPNTVSFRGTVTNVGLFNITNPTPTGEITASVQVRAPGWLAEQDATVDPYDPLATFATATRSVVDAQGGLHLVGSENRGGRAQVVLRSRVGGVWQPVVQVSASPGLALDPTLALLPGGDLAVAWSDSREGHYRIYYRARIRGVWGAETRLAALTGEALSPSLGADARGAVQVAWLQAQSSATQIQFMRFAYPSPFGQPVAVSGLGEHPGPPALAVGPSGTSAVVWTDLNTVPQTIYFARFHPDSGLSPHVPLADPTGNLPQSVQAVMDTAGTLHAIWVVAGPGVSEVHYQRRRRAIPPFPPDSIIASLGGVVQGARLAVDPGGAVHFVYQGSLTNVNQVFYKRWTESRGWDQGATEITAVGDGSTQGPVCLPSASANVSVLFTRFVGGLPRLYERRRIFDTPAAINAVPRGPLVRVETQPRVRPNPLRPGHAAEIVWTGPESAVPPAIELFDLSGRRVATLAARRASGAWVATLDSGLASRLATGVYFVRPAGSAGAAARLVVLR